MFFAITKAFTINITSMIASKGPKERMFLIVPTTFRKIDSTNEG